MFKKQHVAPAPVDGETDRKTASERIGRNPSF
jgi:hypothetical protein